MFKGVKESKHYNYKPLFRVTILLMGHSLISATLGLVGQPKLKKKYSKIYRRN